MASREISNMVSKLNLPKSIEVGQRHHYIIIPPSALVSC